MSDALIGVEIPSRGGWTEAEERQACLGVKGMEGELLQSVDNIIRQACGQDANNQKIPPVVR
jgi:hypothetical protein